MWPNADAAILPPDCAVVDVVDEMIVAVVTARPSVEMEAVEMVVADAKAERTTLVMDQVVAVVEVFPVGMTVPEVALAVVDRKYDVRNANATRTVPTAVRPTMMVRLARCVLNTCARTKGVAMRPTKWIMVPMVLCRKCTFSTLRSRPVSYTHLTLPTTPYV